MQIEPFQTVLNSRDRLDESPIYPPLLSNSERKTMSVKIILFDFDGTLADTLDAIVRITNHLAGDFGFQPATPQDIENLRNLTSLQIVKNSGIPLIKIPFLLHRVKIELNHEIQQLKPIEGIKEVLIELKKLGYKLGIVTSNSEENVKLFIEKNGWQNLFEYLYSTTTLFGKSQVIKKFLDREKINLKDAIYVGDETRDIEAAKKINIKVVAVSWGFNSKQVLVDSHPDFAIDRPDELIEVITRLP